MSERWGSTGRVKPAEVQLTLVRRDHRALHRAGRYRGSPIPAGRASPAGSLGRCAEARHDGISRGPGTRWPALALAGRVADARDAPRPPSRQGRVRAAASRRRSRGAAWHRCGGRGRSVGRSGGNCARSVRLIGSAKAEGVRAGLAALRAGQVRSHRSVPSQCQLLLAISRSSCPALRCRRHPRFPARRPP